ncbi:MAG: hypothetical protein QOK43_1529 [Acidimicrobiaceae bacterium]|nr:hypothetical protein [Acidimicrobiaceae bacterium]
MPVVAPCATCGYNPDDWTADDEAGTLRAAQEWWRELVRDVDGPKPGGAECHDAAAAGDVHGVVHALRTTAAALPSAPGAVGRVAQLNISGGGVPKRPVDTVDVGPRGLTGDRQAARRHHGRPWQALCLWSADVIERLRAEGHPIAPGLAGENVTVEGLDWMAMRPGIRLRLGEVLAETSMWSLPCQKNAAWFVDGDFRRMEHTRERGVSRIYAWVLEPGTVSVGDAVVVSPEI